MPLATYPFAIKNQREMQLVGGFGCPELVLYELAKQHYDLNQSEHSVSMIWTNESASLWYQVLEYPLSELYSHTRVSTVSLTVLHLLCTAQFSLNFIVYTVLCGPVGQTYLKLFSRAKLGLLSVITRNSTELSPPSLVSRQNSSSVSLVKTDYQPQETHL